MQLLFDEQVDFALLTALRRRAPGSETLRVGQEFAPEPGTTDADLLLWCESENWVLVSKERDAMVRAFNQHLASGHLSPGLFLLRPDRLLRQCVEELHVIVLASGGDDWTNSLAYVPCLDPRAVPA